jgi:hypothetical protein
MGSQIRSCGLGGGQSNTGTAFLRALRIPVFEISRLSSDVVDEVDSVHPTPRNKRKVARCDRNAYNPCVRFEVFTAVTMDNGVFWDVTPCGSCKNRRFGGTHRLLHQGDKNR